MRQVRPYRFSLGIVVAIACVVSVPSSLAQLPAANPELQQRVAALKAAVAQNQQALHSYTWTETMQTNFKGETKSTKQLQCQYGPDGTVQKVPISPPEPPPPSKRGLRGRVVEKKKGEMQDYMERVAALIKSYTPPSGPAMQASFQSGRAAIIPSGTGIVTLAFHNYAVSGDTVTLAFDAATKKIQSYNVNTYLDDPSDVVTLTVAFASLPDGTNYVSQSVLDATAKQVQITTVSSGYTKL